MKKSFLFISLALCFNAYAEPVVPASDHSGQINPFTGSRAINERMKLQVESEALKADLALKKFEAGKQEYMLENKEKFYKQELSERLNKNSKAPSMAELNLDAFPEPKVKTGKFAAPKLKVPEHSPSMTMPQSNTAQPLQKLVGIIEVGATKTAVISLGGQTLNVGENSKVGNIVVGAISEDAAVINGQKIFVSRDAPNLANPDKQKLGKGNTVSGPAPVAGVTPMSQTFSLPSPNGPLQFNATPEAINAANAGFNQYIDQSGVTADFQ